MQTKQKALRKFNRVLISSLNTGEPDQLDESLVTSVTEQIPADFNMEDALIISFVNQCHWMLVTLSTIYWCVDGDVNQLKIDSLESAKLDLLTNKKMGFDSKIGFNIISLFTQENEIFNVKIEGGSSLEATMALINELIALRKAV
ncbi:hypothetical protein [Vibrio neptunius]|uniref:hypothetical protein n=1 Tax=Vibrio neptunius TaxID=170651 RepID=UPI0033155A8F